MTAPRALARPPRPQTPILDAWRREMRRRHGDPVPAAAIAEQVGSPTWFAAAWEAAALCEWADGASEAAVTASLLRPYQLLAAAVEDEDLLATPDERAFCVEVRRARAPLSARDRLTVLRLAERAVISEATA